MTEPDSKRSKTEVIDLRELLDGVSLELDKHVDFVTAKRIVNSHCILGEGILYDDEDHAVVWTDIVGKRFHKLQLDYDNADKIIYTTYDLPKRMGSFGLLNRKEGSGIPILCAWEDGFQLYDVSTGQELSEMSKGEDVNPNKGESRLNDGRTDPSGDRFICGGFYGETLGNTEKVFKVEQHPNGKLAHASILDQIEVTNSICWTVDGSRMFLADSPTRMIWSYAYDASNGALSDKKAVYENKVDGKSVPDGSCVDSEGYLWNAVWRSGEGPGLVQRIDTSSGQVVFTVHIPDATSQITCCCFAGENLDILFITSASYGRNPTVEPYAGALYAAKVPFKGQIERRLNFVY